MKPVDFKTCGCVRMIEEALKRPRHQPHTIRPHIQEEYLERNEPEIAAQLRRPWARRLAVTSPESLQELRRGRR